MLSLKTQANKIIEQLETSKLYAECPCPECSHQFTLKDSGLFYMDNFSEKAKQQYREVKKALETQEKEIKDMRKAMKTTSKVGAQAVNLGFLMERLTPCMQTFPFEHNDCRSLFDPIDYLVFSGLQENHSVDKIIFMDIKTGQARLSRSQKEIKNAVEQKHVLWDTYQTVKLK
jgi:predicted Holliday junction resolvase-like endonuclease